MDNKILVEVLEFVRDRYGCSDLDANSTLFADVGLDGNDAYTFFADFSSHFNIDMTYFIASEYFGPERLTALGCLTLLKNIVMRGLGYEPHRIAHVKPITISSLVHAVEMKAWPRSTLAASF